MPKNRYRYEIRAIASYLGLAVGDALGATTEFMTPAEIKATHGVHEQISGGGWLRLKPGQVTDDTTMALALGDAILEHKIISGDSIGKAFSDWLRAKPVDVGHTVRRGIIHYRYSGETVVPYNEFDAGNGACMRCLPVVLACLGDDRQTIAQALESQSHVTHNNTLSDAACMLVAELIHASMEGARKPDLLNGPVKTFVETHPQFEFSSARIENPGGYIVDTMKAVLQAFFNTSSFRDCLVDVVNRGGDADTTGAIAGMIAGSFYGLAGIPGKWLNALDRDISYRCENQAVALVEYAFSKQKLNESFLRRVANQ